MIKNSDRLNKNELDSFQYACTIEELKEKAGRRFIINDIEIAIFKINSEIFALNNVCPHQQTHLIYEGFIEEGFVICPAHGWKFNLRTGEKESGSNGLQSYPVKVIESKVYVKVTPKELRWQA